MDFECTREHLLRAVTDAAEVVDEKATQAVVGTIRIECGLDVIVLKTTDLTTCLTTTVDASVATAGAVQLNAKGLKQRLAALPDGIVRVSVEGGSARIESVGLKRHFAMSVNDERFPAIPSHVGSKGLVLSPEKLRTLVSLGAYAASQEANKGPHLHASLFTLKQHRISVASLDGERVAWVEMEAGGAKDAEWLVPEKGTKIIERICSMKSEGEQEHQVFVTATDPWVFLSHDRNVIAVKTFDANEREKLPRFEVFLEEAAAHKLQVSRLPLLEAVTAVSAAAPEARSLVTLTFDPGKLSLSATGDFGAGVDEVSVDYTGKKSVVCVRHRLLKEALAKAPGENVQLEWDDGKNSMIRVVTPTTKGLVLGMYIGEEE